MSFNCSAEHISQLAFDCVLPSSIFFNTNLEPNSIKLYAMIRNLSKMEGYCYATNQYLGNLLSAEERSVQRWIASLQKEGYVEVVINRKGIQTSRKIYLSEKFKKLLRNDNPVTPPRQSRHPRKTKLSPKKEEYKKEEDKKERERRACALPTPPKIKYGKKVEMQESEYEELVHAHGKIKIDQIIVAMEDYLQAHGKSGYDDYAAAMRNWLRKEPKAKTTISDVLAKNWGFAMKLQKQDPHGKKIEIHPTGIEFLHNLGTAANPFIEYRDPIFKEKVIRIAKKVGFQVEEA